jgi:hypothetical protein
MTLAKRLLVLMSVVALAACTSKSFESKLSVESTFNPDGNYGSYETYGWVDYGTDVVVIEDPDTRQSVVKAIENTLEARGLRHDRMAPDLMIGYHGAVETKLDQVVVDSYYDENNYNMDTSPGKNVDSWEVGTLVLLIFDAKDGTLLWRASAQAELDEKRVSRSEQRRRIELAVNKMLETLPTEEDVQKAIDQKGN